MRFDPFNLIIWGVPALGALIVLAGLFGWLDLQYQPLANQVPWLVAYLGITLRMVGTDIATAIREGRKC